ncbi:MAG: DUF4157 domain-containing protein [Anaerolineae bacterium]|nr:DUF4157 domain-containing protein [Anaerolineae bacterium]
MGNYSSREYKPAPVQRSTTTPETHTHLVPQVDGGIHDLQRLLGNQGVQRLLTANPGLAQAKLTVGAANDAYEQEADRVAGEVMSMQAPAAGSDAGVQREAAPEDDDLLQGKRDASLQRAAEDGELAMLRISNFVQRDPFGGEVEDDIQEQRIQRAEDGQDLMGSFDVEGQLEGQIQSQKGGGQAMDNGDRSFFESRFGQDFSDVKVHTGGDSAAVNRSLGARAFTNGSDVFMGGGQYSPGSSASRELLAHELTHVVQQTGSKPLQPKRDETCDGC